MTDKIEKRRFVFLDKLKKIKHLDIILTALFVSIILLIYFSTNSSKGITSQSGAQSSIENMTEFEEYSSSLTSKIEEVVSSVKNAGQVKALLNFSDGIKEEIAYTYETKTLSDGNVVETKKPVLTKVNGEEKPIILQKIMPKPTSVIIVASGAKDTNVKLEILRLLQATFNLSSSNIEIFAGN